MEEKTQRSLEKICHLLDEIRQEVTSLAQSSDKILSELDPIAQFGEILDTSTQAIETTPEKRLLILLHELEMPTHILGYNYIKAAILYLYEHTQEAKKTSLGVLNKKIAREFNTTASAVERDIRHTIEQTFAKASLKLQELFPKQTKFEEKATNGEFLYRILKYIQTGL